ncbi:MAG TPA: hypothetical protein VMZ53_10460 [Kofleriaceae bacterium]|nr:hypothetical protein [Kofleriaceae bacterium]
MAANVSVGSGVGKTLSPLRSAYVGVDVAGRLGDDPGAFISGSLSYIDAKTFRFPFRAEARYGSAATCRCPDMDDQHARFTGVGLSVLMPTADMNIGGGSDRGLNELGSDYRQFYGFGLGIDVDRVIGDWHATIVTLSMISDNFILRDREPY